MRNLFKKSLAFCLVAALALTCFIGSFSVSAATTYNATITASASELTFSEDAQQATITLTITSDSVGISEALLKVSTAAGTISDAAVTSATVKTETDNTVDTTSEDSKLSQVLTIDNGNASDFGSFTLSANQVAEGDATVLTSFSNAVISLTLDVNAGLTAGSYPISIETNGVKAASNSEDVINFSYSSADVVVGEKVLEVTYAASVSLGSGDPLNFETLEEAVETAYDYSTAAVDGKFYDPIITLNKDVTINEDLKIASYNTLALGSYTVTSTSGAKLAIIGTGVITATYIIDYIAENPMMSVTSANSVYTHKVAFTFDFNSASLELGDSIFINFSAKIANFDTLSGITFGLEYYKATDPSNSYEVLDEEIVKTYSSDKLNKITGQTIGIPAKEMGVKFVATYYAKMTKGGIDYYVYSTTANYCVVDYAKTILDKDETKTGSHNLLKAMLNYGTAAQYNFNYDLNNLANSILDETDKVLPTNYVDYIIAPQYIDQLKDFATTTAFAGPMSLELLDSVNVNHIIKQMSSDKTYKLCVWTYKEYTDLIADETDRNLISQKLVLANAARTIDCSLDTLDSKTGLWNGKAINTGIAAKNLADTYVYRLVEIDDSGNEKYDWTISTSPLEYAKTVVDGTGYTANLKELCKRLAVYSAMARVYFNNYTVNSQ